MLGKITRILTLTGAFILTAVVSTPSEAIPAWARQTGKACSTCHFNGNFPALNEYGMEFKAGGYTDIGKQGLIKGKDLSLPDVFNASIYTKIRHQKDSGSDAAGNPSRASGQLQFPDEFAILSGGRVAENVGYMMEFQLANSSAFLAGFKMPFMFKLGPSTKVGAIPFTTDGLGVAYGFELLSTGAVRNIRGMEHRTDTSAQQYIGTDSKATGAAFVVWDPKYFVNFSKWSPTHLARTGGDNDFETSKTPKANYVRAALTPTLGDWALGLGVQSWSGTSEVGGDAGARPAVAPDIYDTRARAYDFQAQGAVGSLPVGVYVTHARAPAAGTGNANLFNTQPNAKSATGILAQLGVIPNKVNLSVAHLDGNRGTATNSKDSINTLGVRYLYAQNIAFRIEHSYNSTRAGYDGTDTKGKQRTTLMLDAGF